MAKAEKPKQDMGTGSVKKLMVQMAVPALVGQVVNLLYNIVDRIYIGHIPEIGGLALTGVGLTFPVITLILAFVFLHEKFTIKSFIGCILITLGTLIMAL